MTFQNGTANGIYFEMTGADDGPVLVFSHSLGGDLSMWDAQADAFATSYRILRYDTRGHGRSEQPAQPLTLADLGRDVIGLLDYHSVEKAHFCGLSLGGMTGMWLGLNAPERFHSWILADTAPQMGTNDVWNARIRQIEQGGMSAVAPATMERWFTRPFRERAPGVVAHFEAILAGTDPAGYTACARVVQSGVLPLSELHRLTAITAPALVLTGSEDAAAPPDLSKSFASFLPNSRFMELNAAHIAAVEASDAFNAAALAFMQEVCGS